jgi:flagellar biosynthesis protein FlhB
VVNPSHLAVAVLYDRGAMVAPQVIAKGQAGVARQIVRQARRSQVPIVRDVPLARALFELEVDGNVPPELFEAVAEVLLFAWEASGEAGRRAN